MGDNKDKLVDEYPGGQGDLTRLYGRVDKPEPPASLDREILEAARKGIHPGGRVGGPFGAQWYVPVSLAAVLVLAVGVVVTLEKETGQEASLIQEYKPVARPVPARPPETSRQKKAVTNDAPAPVEPKADRQVPVAVPREAVEHEVQKMIDEAPEAEVSKQAPAKRELTRERAAPGSMQEVAPASATEATDVDVRSKEGVDTVNKPAGVTDVDSTAEPVKPAAQWLQSIRLLLEQGHVDEAKRQYVDFRRQYPDYPVDSDLQDSLR